MIDTPFSADMQNHGHWAHMRDVPPTQFQVLGERASGTNVIRKLIELNTGLKRTEGLGWKHGFPHMVAIPAQCLVIGAVRAPVPWVLSMHKRPWHAHPDLQALPFGAFLRAPWRSVMDHRGHFEMLADDIAPKGEDLQLDRHPITGLPFDNLLALRQAKLAALAGMANRGCSLALVQMEWATAQPAAFLDWIAQITGAPRTGDLRLPRRRMGNNYKRSVAQVPETPATLAPDDLAFVQTQLDGDLERAFGYDLTA